MTVGQATAAARDRKGNFVSKGVKNLRDGWQFSPRSALLKILGATTVLMGSVVIAIASFVSLLLGFLVPAGWFLLLFSVVDFMIAVQLTLGLVSWGILAMLANGVIIVGLWMGGFRSQDVSKGIRKRALKETEKLRRANERLRELHLLDQESGEQCLETSGIPDIGTTNLISLYLQHAHLGNSLWYLADSNEGSVWWPDNSVPLYEREIEQAYWNLMRHRASLTHSDRVN
jgi:hypothetical protein